MFEDRVQISLVNLTCKELGSISFLEGLLEAARVVVEPHEGFSLVVCNAGTGDDVYKRQYRSLCS